MAQLTCVERSPGVAGQAEPQLLDALDRLVDAGLILRRGLPGSEKKTAVATTAHAVEPEVAQRQVHDPHVVDLVKRQAGLVGGIGEFLR